MKNIISIAITAIVLVAVYAFINPRVDFESDTEGGIQFHNGSWDAALNLAKKENKLIFLDIYATWCGPCKQLKKYTFANTKVGSFYNKNFINVSFNGEVGDGATLAKKYKITGYPTLLFIDGDGNIVSQTAGYHNPDELITLGQKFITK